MARGQGHCDQLDTFVALTSRIHILILTKNCADLWIFCAAKLNMCEEPMFQEFRAFFAATSICAYISFQDVFTPHELRSTPHLLSFSTCYSSYQIKRTSLEICATLRLQLSVFLFLFFGISLFALKAQLRNTREETCDKRPGPDLKAVAGLWFAPEPAESPGRPSCISHFFAL